MLIAEATADAAADDTADTTINSLFSPTHSNTGQPPEDMDTGFTIQQGKKQKKTHKRTRSTQSLHSNSTPGLESPKKAKKTTPTSPLPPCSPPSPKTNLSPLFTEISADADSAKIFLELKKHIRYSRRTQAGNLLIYPRSAADNTTLLSLNLAGCKIRDTKKSRTPDDSLTVVIIGVPPNYSNDDFSSISGLPNCIRMQSAALGRPTNRIKVICSSPEEKQGLLTNGLSFDFRKLKVEEYKSRRPLQCIRCQSFGHRANTCSLEIRCKRCGLGHGHKECPSPEKASCTNCKGNHPASFSGCPSYKEALLSKKSRDTNTAQKIAPPANILDATRIAATVAQILSNILQPLHPGISEDSILSITATTVSNIYKVNMTPIPISEFIK
jgi:hypothetical protein